MISSIKHNKYKNSGVIFELLIRQVASDTMSGKDSPAVNIIKKYFNNTELAKEYKLYYTLSSAKSLTESKANVLIDTVVEMHSKLNRLTLRREKYNVIKEIKDNYNIEEFFKAKIDNYSKYGSAYILFESKTSRNFPDPKQIISIRTSLLESLTNEFINKENVEIQVLEDYKKMDKNTKVLAYRILLEKFNEKYSNLLPTQKSILKEYINHISDGVKLKEYVNEQFTKLKDELTKSSKYIQDPVVKIKVNEVINLIKPFDKKCNVKDNDVIALLQYQQLLHDINAVK